MSLVQIQPIKEPDVSRAKAPPAKRSENGYVDKNDSYAASCFVPRLHSILTIKSGTNREPGAWWLGGEICTIPSRVKPGDKVGLFSSFKTFASVRDLMNKKEFNTSEKAYLPKRDL